MSTRAIVVGMTLACAFGSAPLVLGQGTQTGTVRGWARDAQGLALLGVCPSNRL